METEAKKGVSALVASSVICFGVGVAVGIVVSTVYEAKWYTPFGPTAPDSMAADPRVQPPNGPRVPGPTAKTQLASLVDKLDSLTKKPATINLTDEQRKKLRDQLQGLDEKNELSEEEAKKRLDALLEVVQPEKEKLESAGYRWSAPIVAGTRPADTTNPFKDEQNSKHLKSLWATLTN